MRSFVPLVKDYYATLMSHDKKLFKNTCQHCNGYVKCSGKIGKILYINFIHEGMISIGISPEDINPDNYFFPCPGRTKMKHICHMI